MKKPLYTCEACCKPDPVGVRCPECHKALIAQLLNSPEWVRVAKTRPGDLPGETMHDTMQRELNAIGREFSRITWR